MSMFQEFKAFSMRGNVIDLAIGVVIGLAFGKIVSTFVENIVMPLLGIVVGKVSFSSLAFSVRGSSISYGVFLQAVFDFLIVAFAIFLLVKAINSMKRKEEAKPAVIAEVPADVKLLAEIRDLLARQAAR